MNGPSSTGLPVLEWVLTEVGLQNVYSILELWKNIITEIKKRRCDLNIINNL